MKSFLYIPLASARFSISALSQELGRNDIVGLLCFPGICYSSFSSSAFSANIFNCSANCLDCSGYRCEYVESVVWIFSCPSLSATRLGWAPSLEISKLAWECLKCRALHFRHSHASLLIHMEFSILAVSERLGHEKVQTTLELYGHLYPDVHGNVAQQLQESAGEYLAPAAWQNAQKKTVTSKCGTLLLHLCKIKARIPFIYKGFQAFANYSNSSHRRLITAIWIAFWLLFIVVFAILSGIILTGIKIVLKLNSR